MAVDVRRPAVVGAVLAGCLVTATIVVPELGGWVVHERSDDSGLAPLNGFVDVRVGPGSLFAVIVGIAVIAWGPRVAVRLGWRPLLGVTMVVSLGWLVSLALVDGPEGLSRVLGNPHEYLGTARAVTSVPDLLSTYTEHIRLDAEDRWPVHVAGHPPGMLLFFVLLVQLGLGGDLAAGLVVTTIASTLPAAVLVTLRALDREVLARSLAPYLVVTPAAVFLAVSADAVIATTVAWGLAALALASRRGPRDGWGWAVVAGLLLGYAVMMSYGMPLAGILALAVLMAARSWWPLPVAFLSAWLVVLAFVAGGFTWWEALSPLRQRYWEGIAADRPGTYWWWGNLGALFLSGGLAMGASIGAGLRSWGSDRVAALLVGGALLAIVLADASMMSKAEVERIWLPFMPWLTVGTALLPRSWTRWVLALQVATALLVQHLLDTTW
ncbi:MAG: hypothetical protein NTX33_17075 [Propionibacteriales bacterium]|nr:hypothetical protein [Propionibacteriales bacterium]